MHSLIFLGMLRGIFLEEARLSQGYFLVAFCIGLGVCLEVAFYKPSSCV